MKLVRALHIILLDVIYVMIAIVFRNLGSVELARDKSILSNARDKTHKGRFVNKNDLSSASGSPSEREIETPSGGKVSDLSPSISELSSLSKIKSQCKQILTPRNEIRDTTPPRSVLKEREPHLFHQIQTAIVPQCLLVLWYLRRFSFIILKTVPNIKVCDTFFSFYLNVCDTNHEFSNNMGLCGGKGDFHSRLLLTRISPPFYRNFLHNFPSIRKMEGVRK